HPQDDCGLSGAAPRLAAHLMLEERADPQPRPLPAERDRRADEAVAVDTTAGVKDSAQAARGLFEQPRLPLLEIADPGRLPPASRLRPDDHDALALPLSSVSRTTRPAISAPAFPAARIPGN